MISTDSERKCELNELLVTEKTKNPLEDVKLQNDGGLFVVVKYRKLLHRRRTDDVKDKTQIIIF